MLVYIALRFKLEYGVAAIFTLAQDVLITMTLLFVHQPRDQPAHHRRHPDHRRLLDQRHHRHLRPRPGEPEAHARQEPLEEVMNVSLNQMPGPDDHHLGHGLPDRRRPVPLRRRGHQRLRLPACSSARSRASIRRSTCPARSSFSGRNGSSRKMRGGDKFPLSNGFFLLY
ncbi:MAG: hypothetical protein M0C28_42770 [Candidatus Moduliflexus flocculans]|nr:hypothetical protein [Candidatus Moduliflexus flocculans]